MSVFWYKQFPGTADFSNWRRHFSFSSTQTHFVKENKKLTTNIVVLRWWEFCTRNQRNSISENLNFPNSSQWEATLGPHTHHSALTFPVVFGTSLDVLVLHLEGQLGEVGTGFLAGNQSFLLSMKYIDHWMKGKYEYTRNYEQRLIYLSNSIARDLHARVRHGRPSARRFQTAHAFFIHSGNFPSGNKGLLLETARFSVTSFYHHNIKAYCPNRYSITPKVLVMDCLILSSGHNLKLTFT